MRCGRRVARYTFSGGLALSSSPSHSCIMCAGNMPASSCRRLCSHSRCLKPRTGRPVTPSTNLLSMGKARGVRRGGGVTRSRETRSEGRRCTHGPWRGEGQHEHRVGAEPRSRAFVQLNLTRHPAAPTRSSCNRKKKARPFRSDAAPRTRSAARRAAKRRRRSSA